MVRTINSIDVKNLPADDEFGPACYNHENNINLLNADYGEGWQYAYDLDDDNYVYNREPTPGHPACSAYFNACDTSRLVFDENGNRLN